MEVLRDALKKAKISLKSGDIIAVVSKVVALTEGELANLDPVNLGPENAQKNLKTLIENEADLMLSKDNVDFALTIKNGILTPNAGIDQSNIPAGYALGWPRDSYTSAQKLLTELKKNLTKDSLKTSSKSTSKNSNPASSSPHLGLLIFDSYITPLRNGVTGISLGYDGFHGLQDYRGKKDLFGKTLRVTQKNIVDNLSSAATLMTGEGSESIPFVVIRDAPVKFTTKTSRSEITRDPVECLYKELYKNSGFRS